MTDDPLALAWAAGLFEGEGCIASFRGNQGQRRIYMRLDISMTDEDTLRKFLSIVGVGKIRGPVKHPSPEGKKWKDKWIWTATGMQALRLAHNPQFADHLCSRRAAKLQEILTLIEGQPPLIRRNAHITHCKHGHPFDAVNTLWNNGHRQCRQCGRNRYRAFVERHGQDHVRVTAKKRRERLIREMLAAL